MYSGLGSGGSYSGGCGLGGDGGLAGGGGLFVLKMPLNTKQINNYYICSLVSWGFTPKPQGILQKVNLEGRDKNWGEGVKPRHFSPSCQCQPPKRNAPHLAYLTWTTSNGDTGSCAAT